MGAWLSLLTSQPDSLSPEFEKIYRIYRDTNIHNMIVDSKTADILDDRISEGLRGGSYICYFSPQPGIYYLLYKVKMSYVLFDDQEKIFLTTITQHITSSFLSMKRGKYFMSICPFTDRRICTRLIPLSKRKNIPVALPYKVELLEPYQKR